MTTPKFPPPQRRAQYGSAFSFVLAVRTCPSAVPRSAEIRLAIDKPNAQARYLMPRPSVERPAPVGPCFPGTSESWMISDEVGSDRRLRRKS